MFILKYVITFPCNASQVNSKGYKVCGEASSVCGTITINKRKVGILRQKCDVREPHKFLIFVFFFFFILVDIFRLLCFQV